MLIKRSARWTFLLLLVAPLAAFGQSSAAPAGVQAMAIEAGDDSGSGETPQNITAATAIGLVPDGTAVSDNNGDGTTQWFAAKVESGKSYVIDAFHLENDRTANAVTLAVFDADGTTSWTGGSASCGADQASAAPSLETSGATPSTADGARCAVRTFTGLTPATPLIFIRATVGFAGKLTVRMRENTVYCRYTVNGYNMFVPIHNVSSTAVAGFVTFYGSTTTTSSVTTENAFNLGAYQATQIVRNSGTITPNTGTIRVLVNGPGTDVSMQAYAFNTGIGQYLFFVPERFNNASGTGN